MEDKKNILSEINFIDTDWIEKRELACNTVLYLYYKISEKFSKDSKYGPKFVADNQQLMGMLVQTAMSELQSIHQQNRMDDLIDSLKEIADKLSISISNISYAIEEKTK